MAIKTEKAAAEVVAKKIIKKGMFSRGFTAFWEMFQKVWDELFEIYILSHILGMSRERGKEMAQKNEGDKEKEKTLGTGARMFHAFSHDDEIKWNRMFAAARKICNGCEEKFMTFLHGAVDCGYDEDTLRVRLIGSFSEKDGDDAAIETIKTIADMDGDLNKQIQFAKDRKLLVKKNLKNFLMKGKDNKLAAIMWLIVILLAILRGCTWIFA